MSNNTQFTIFLYLSPFEIEKNLENNNEITFIPTYQAWEGLGIFGLGYAECKMRFFLRPSSVLVAGYRYIVGQDIASATLALNGATPISIRINNAERRRILRIIHNKKGNEEMMDEPV